VRAIGVTEQTYYRWRKEYGGLQVDQAKRMKDLEKENQRLRRAVSDLTLDNQILKEVAQGKF
jgi:transposase-like protein